MFADAEKFGIPQEMFDQLVNEEVDFEVYEDNWESLELFLRLRTQWVTMPFGGLRGLDYAGLNAVLQMLKVSDTGRAFSDMQIMESAALAVFAERENGPEKHPNKLHRSSRR